jgi:large subunit ribosomal protein L25
VKSGGLLEQQLFTLPVEAKPQDIPAAIEVDVTHLGLGDQLRLSEIALPAGVTISLDPDTLVAAIAVPRGLAAAAASEGAEGEAAPEESAATPTAAEVAEGAESDEE